MNAFFSRWARLVIRLRGWVVLAVLVITALLLTQARSLKLVIDPNTLLPQHHPHVVTTRLVEEVFGSKHVIVIGVQPRQGDIYHPEAVAYLQRFTQRLYETPGVRRNKVLGITAHRAKDIQGGAEGMVVQPLVPPGALAGQDAADSARLAAALKSAIARNPVYASTAVSDDGRLASIVIEMAESSGGYRAMLAPIERIVADLADQRFEVFVGGNPVYLAASERFSARMAFLFPLAILIVGLVHFEAFRTLQGLFLPLATALLAVTWALGLMGAARVPLDIFNTPTPILILAVAAGHAVQLLKRYYEDFGRLSEGLTDPVARKAAALQAIVDSITAVGPVMVVAGGVAAMGFISLLSFELSTIRTFGLFTAAGILSALILEMSFIPALRAILKAPSPKHVALERKRRVWDRITASVADAVLGPRRRILPWVLAGIALIACVGAAQVRIDNANKGLFAAWLPFQKDDSVLNASLAGTNTLYIVVDGRRKDALKDPALLASIERIQLALAAEPGVGKTVSIVDFVRRMHHAMNADAPGADGLPDRRELIAQYLFLYSMAGDPADFDTYVDFDYRRANIVVYLKSGSSAYADRLIARATAAARDAIGDRADFSIGGSVAQTAALTQVMVDGKIRNILQIAAVIFVVTALLFRSVLAGLLVLAPLTMAVLVNFGVLGWTGTPLNIPNSLSSAMAVGIGADYAIYLIFRLREECRRGVDLDLAIRQTLATAGKACLYVASAISAGYGVLLLSFGFNVHLWLALLIGIAMLVSVFSALLIVPAAVRALRPAFIFRADRGAPHVPPAGAALGTVGAVVALALLAASSLSPAPAAAATPPSAERIMELNLEVSKVDSSLTETTYVLINAGGQERSRRTIGYTKLHGPQRDSKRLTRFVEPADVRGTGVLMIENSGREDDMWVWLPAMNKVRRLVSSNKRDAFLGTDLSYGDVIGHRVADWQHTLLREDTLDGVPCYVIESVPRSRDVQTASGYSRRLSWIRKDNFLTWRGEFFDEARQPLKSLQAQDARLIEAGTGKWLVTALEARNLQTGHRTRIRVDDIKVNPNLRDETFTTRFLERD